MNCPLCKNNNYSVNKIYLNDIKKYAKIATCKNCDLKYLLGSKNIRKSLYNKNYSVWGADESKNEKIVEESKKIHFRYILSKLRKYTNFKEKSLLDVGTGKGYLLDVAKEMGFKKVYGLEVSEYSSKIAEKKFPGKIYTQEVKNFRTRTKFDVITLTDLIEHLEQIDSEFENISNHLKKGGYILITTPNTDSITRTLLRGRWFQYKYEHPIYFNKKSIRYLLNGRYDILLMNNNKKNLKMGYYKLYLKKYSGPLIGSLIPGRLENISIINPFCGELFIIAKKIK